MRRLTEIGWNLAIIGAMCWVVAGFLLYNAGQIGAAMEWL